MNNYLGLEKWYDMMEVESVDQAIRENKRTLSYIKGFQMVLPDGEVEDKNCGIK